MPATSAVLDELAAWARSERLARLRVEPEAPAGFRAELEAAGFRRAPALHPEHTQVVPLGEDEAMLAAMKEKHRYNTRLSLRRGVEVEAGGDVDELVRQTRSTAARQGITLPGADFYRRRLAAFAWSRIYVARHEGRALAAIMVARHGGRAYYLFGGSTGEGSALKPTYAVQWAAMREAAAAGDHDYDLWGMPPGPEVRDHPWAGLWQFKSGFGGSLVEYAGAWDLDVDPTGSAMLSAREAARAAVKRFAFRRNIP